MVLQYIQNYLIQEQQELKNLDLREKFYVYDFNRSIDGYPEKTVITGSFLI